MGPDRAPLPRTLLLLVLAGLTLPGDGNEGSITGNCHCDNRIPNPRPELKEHLRKYLKNYQNCPPWVRFHLPQRTVCGGGTQSWVRELMSCFDRKECGHSLLGNRVAQKNLSPLSTQATEVAPSHTATSVHTLQSVQQPTFTVIAQSLDGDLIHCNETITPPMGHSLGAASEAGENQKQLKDNVGSSVLMSAKVAVPSLLAIVFILTVSLLYVICKKKKAQSRQQQQDLQVY